MTGETLLQPFIIHMADGRALPVAHPELIAYKSETRTAIVVYDESIEFIDLPLATGLKFRELEEAHTAEND
ncbi:MAG: hypothetical protein WKF75_09705, partial [Singulisphaera sp.]